jgi:hypothetical protein
MVLGAVFGRADVLRSGEEEGERDGQNEKADKMDVGLNVVLRQWKGLCRS